MAAYKRLHDAGAILRMDRTYPGAAAQSHSLMQRGVLKLAEHAPEAGALAGHGVGAGFMGTGIGMGVKGAAHKLVGKSGAAAVERRIQKLQ
jgi:hypothetical protein